MKVLLRADGNGAIGYGHLSRLNALANIIGQEFKVIFLTRYDSNISLIGLLTNTILAFNICKSLVNAVVCITAFRLKVKKK